jgi:uncharacterized membrane protein YdbT with pleckstrin-like domain
MRYPTRLLTDDEEIVRQFNPHWRVLLGAGMWLVVGIAAMIAGPALADGRAWMQWGGIAVGGLVILALAVPPVVRWRFRLYVLTTERIIVRDGIISRGGTEIPLENINNVIFSQSVLERMLGYGDVLIESAGAQGQSRMTDIPDPEAFQSELYRVREARSIELKGVGSASSSAPRDAVAQLEALAELHARGALTDAEFEAKKSKLLGEI